jgi:hypothetical protein
MLRVTSAVSLGECFNVPAESRLLITSGFAFAVNATQQLPLAALD